MLKDRPRNSSQRDGIGSRALKVMRRMVSLPEESACSGNPDLLFIWVPKTAGTSVFTFLSAHLGMIKLKTAKQAMSFRNRGAVTFGHLHYLSLLEAGFVRREFHDSAFKFACVRNPYARAASLYNYLRERNLAGDACFDRFLDNIRHRPPIGFYNRSNLSMTNPISDWIMGQDGQLLVNKFFKVEEMDVFVRHFETCYGVRFDRTERRNESTRFVTVKDITENPERVEKINRIYERDFDLLGYDMIAPEARGA